MTEGQLQTSVLDCAKRLGWRVARFPAANFVRTRDGREFVKPLSHDTKGFPDALLVRERLVAVEFKAAAGYQSGEQSDWHCWLLDAGVEMYVWRPADWRSGVVERTLQLKRQVAA